MGTLLRGRKKHKDKEGNRLVNMNQRSKKLAQNLFVQKIQRSLVIREITHQMEFSLTDKRAKCLK